MSPTFAVVRYSLRGPVDVAMLFHPLIHSYHGSPLVVGTGAKNVPSNHCMYNLSLAHDRPSSNQYKSSKYGSGTPFSREYDTGAGLGPVVPICTRTWLIYGPLKIRALQGLPAAKNTRPDTPLCDIKFPRILVLNKLRTRCTKASASRYLHRGI